MSEPSVEEKVSSLLLALIGFALLLALVLMAFFSAVGSLNRDLYSASGFVRTYLTALERHDVGAALGIAGVDIDQDAHTDLLDPAAMGTLRNIKIVADNDLGAGRHRVTATYDLTATGRESASGRTEFVVQNTGLAFGLLSSWRFTDSPTATLEVNVQHASTFVAGSRDVEISEANEGDFGATREYTVLVPDLFVFAHDSHYLGSQRTSASVQTVGGTTSVFINAQPNVALVEAVQAKIDEYVNACASERKLYPDACPFGEAVENRINSEPVWSIVASPSVSVIAGNDSWLVPESAGIAHISVEVTSLFDGSVSTLEKDVPFTLTAALTIDTSGSIVISLP